MEATIENNIAKLIKLIEIKYLSTDKSYQPIDLALKT